MGDDTSVRVAVRIRPQIPREVIDMCRICTSVTPGEPQVWLGNDKAFTYDFVFDTNTFQAQVYEACVKTLIEGCFEGYNATVLAYGQTGSGKTYTMGTGFDMNVTEDEVGIIPRAVNQLFEGIEDRRQQSIANSEQPPEFKIVCQFMELYNEEVIDLFDTTRDALSRGRKSNIKIHEDSTGAIYTAGLTSKIVTTKLETMQCLKLGALSRTTASTQMNVQSSRSHAIFTLHIMQQRLVKCKDPDSDTNEMSEFETLTAKFHFVDLAGSERLKRTGATGERAKEGISINCGLLALGNVISALGDKTKRGHHVPYRDSKLTRLLQDSLGGNSRTVMIACISPSDRDFMETLNTLKYANRARNIKNRVTVNQDKTSKTISALRMEIQQLQLELMEYKQLLDSRMISSSVSDIQNSVKNSGDGEDVGKRLIVDGVESVNDMYHENTMLQSENNNLRTRIKAMQETVDQLTARNTQLLAEKSIGSWINSDDGSNSDISQVIKGYLKEIEELRAKLLESENTCQILRRTATKVHGRTSLTAQPSSSSFDLSFGADETEIVDEILEEAKLNLVRLKRKEKHTKIKNSVSEKENAENDEKAEGDEKKDQNSEDEDNMEEITEDDASSSDTDSEENNKYEEDLAELTCEISIKQKLIEELELSQRRLQTMRQQYEEKLLQLQNKIRATQEERDKVLSNLETRGNQTEDKAKKVKDEYEKKINNLQSELKKLQAAKKEHARLVKSQSQYEHQLKTLRNELTEMKKTKVRLINKMKEESAKHKEEESRRNREIAQLKKESRKRENQIRTLEADKRLKETVLRRKQEEVIALRRQNKPMSDKVAGRVPRPKTAPAKSNIYRKLNAFSPKLAKQKWQKVEKEIHKLALSRQAVANVEKDMERWLKEREKLTRDMEKSLKKRDKAIVDRMDEAVIKDLEDYIENLKTNIDYVQENITDCQTNIVQMEETKDNEIFDPTALTSVEELEEAKYLLEKLITFAINQGIAVAQKEAGMKELEAEMNQVVQNNSLHQQLLQHLLAQTDMDIYNYMVMNDNVANVPSTESSRSNSPVESSSSTAFEFPVVPSPSSESIGRSSMRDKARRRTATPQELLFAGKEGPPLGLSIPSIVEDQTRSCNIELISNNNHDENCNSNGIPRVPSAPGSLKAIVTGKIEINSRFSPIMGRKTYERPLPDVSPRLPRKFTLHSSTSNLFLSRQSSIDNSSDVTPPTSPTTTRRSRDDNVFSRLTSHSSLNSETNPNRGEIIPFSGKMKPAPLVCTHVAEGHSKAVLTVAATENLLFSGAKDRTVKIWDLNKGMEIQSLEGFPNNVCVVRYAETSSQVFTVSSSFIKVWDIRENPAKCMRTLSSSGLTTNGSTMLGHFVSRTLQMPPGEIQINDIALNRQGTVLFSAAGSAVRIWDLRKFQCIGRLSGGHQAAVMCLAVEELDKSNNIVITGSKDHYIKVFEVTEGIGGMHTPKLNLEPPHYDGIQSLAVTGSYLFSGSRDMCIKKWDLKENILKQSLNQAHKDWICGLSIIPGGQILLSGCRGGYMKLWSVENCIQLGEIRAHASPINAITTNSSAVFSASSDGTIGMWRLKMSNDVSPELSDAN